MSGRAATHLLAGLAGGLCAASLVVLWLHAAGPSPEVLDDTAELRRDLVVLSAQQVALVEDVDARLAAVEARLAEPTADPGARHALTDVAADLRLLRDALQLELAAVQDELVRLAGVLEDVAGARGGIEATAPLSDAEEPRHVVLSTNPDEGVRFSALVRLGRRRTDRSVQASLACLDDPAERVVWAALRNLGSFREPSTAPSIAGLLGHERAVVRMAAHEALRQMGAPDEPSFDPVGEKAEREAARAALVAWARQFATE